MAQRKATTTKRKRTTKPAKPVATAVMTTSGTLRLVEPVQTKKRRASKPKVVHIVGQTDDVLLNQVGGFANFIREYAVVGLAIGFIAGQQANAVVKQMVDSFVNPWVTVMFGTSLIDQKAILHHGATEVPVPWGKFVYILLQFFLVLITVYAVVKIFKLDRLKKVDEPAKDAKATEVIIEEAKPVKSRAKTKK